MIGDKWKPIVLFILGKGMKRYGELRRCLPDVSKKMLTQEYELSPLGQSFLEPVMELCRWASGHTDDLDAVKACRKQSLRRKQTSPSDK